MTSWPARPPSTAPVAGRSCSFAAASEARKDRVSPGIFQGEPATPSGVQAAGEANVLEEMTAFAGGEGPLIASLAIWLAIAVGIVVVYRRRRSPLKRAALVIVPSLVFDGLYSGQGILSVLAFVVGFGSQVLFALLACAQRRGGVGLQRLGAAGLYFVSIPVMLLWIAGNNRIANDRAWEIIAACRRFEHAHGAFPRTLDELVPDYLPHVPRAKYTFGHWGEFEYRAHRTLSTREQADLRALAGAVSSKDWGKAAAAMGRIGLDQARAAILVARAAHAGLEVDGEGPLHSLQYYVFPPFGRRVYFFEQQRWFWID